VVSKKPKQEPTWRFKLDNHISNGVYTRAQNLGGCEVWKAHNQLLVTNNQGSVGTLPKFIYMSEIYFCR